MASSSVHSLHTNHDEERLNATANTPVPYDSDLLDPPNRGFNGMLSTESPRDSYANSSPAPRSPNQSSSLLNGKEGGVMAGAMPSSLRGSSDYDGAAEKEGTVPRPLSQRRGSKFWIIAALVALVVAAAVAVPVGVVLSKKNNNNKSASGGNSDGGSGGGSGDGGNGGNGGNSGGKNPTTGGNGSIITTADGTKFTYINNFGGFWVADPEDPFNNNAQPNSWTSPLNTTWKWGTDHVFGVNLGGWFVLEPFITPALYQKYQTSSVVAVDEWTLSQAMAADTAGGGINQLEDHYNTFITEQDIAEIAGAGLNYVRVPMPFWAMNSWNGEPFLQQVVWKYILRLFTWCRKYGIRINIDLHTIPGSQNGYNHSGKLGQVNFMVGVMGYANAQRALEYIRTIAEFITQPEYQNLIPIFSVINEPLVSTIGTSQISEFYFQVYTMLRSITGFGEGKGAYMAIGDGFQGTEAWAGFFAGSDRMILDTHPYIAFNGQPNNDPVAVWPTAACKTFAPGMASSQTGFGISLAGEFSNGYNDCGFYLRGTTDPHTSSNCSFWSDSSQWDDATKQGVKQYALASMDALQNWYFWTWKIGNMTSGTVGAPLWSYQLGLQQGWMPTDPREASGVCASLGVTDKFTGQYAASATGGGSGDLGAAATASFGVWPPKDIVSVSAQINLVPTYTATVSQYTLPAPTFTPAPAKSVSIGDGWADSADTASSVTTVAGCTYPDAWDSAAQTMPAAACTGAPARAARFAVRAEVTPAPKA